VQPQEEDEEEQVEEERSSYPSSIHNNCNAQIPTKPLLILLKMMKILYCLVLLHVEQLYLIYGRMEGDIKEIGEAISSLDDRSLCGDSIQNYVGEFSFDA
jgi:hypothetical protein